MADITVVADRPKIDNSVETPVSEQRGRKENRPAIREHYTSIPELFQLTIHTYTHTSLNTPMNERLSKDIGGVKKHRRQDRG